MRAQEGEASRFNSKDSVDKSVSSSARRQLSMVLQALQMSVSSKSMGKGRAVGEPFGGAQQWTRDFCAALPRCALASVFLEKCLLE